MERNIALYPWFRGLNSLLFWQAAWFLYFESVLGAAEAILLYAILDLCAVVLEVPSGYFSDRVGRRATLIIAMLANIAGCSLLFAAGSFPAFVLAQVFLAVGISFVSGTDHALLFDSLKSAGREEELAHEEAKAWRFGYLGLAISAAVGGFVSTYSMAFSFLLTALASLAALVVVFLVSEPKHVSETGPVANPLGQAKTVLASLADRVLLWLFCFMVAGYVLSHVPYVFAQPYLREVLEGWGLGAETPAVAGIVIAAMMAASAMTAGLALPLRDRIGALGNFILSLVMQTGLILVLALVVHPLAGLLLVLRMVPNALSQPLVLAEIQPRLRSDYRATYLSFQSLVSRLVMSSALALATWLMPEESAAGRSGLATVLPWFGVAGLAATGALWATGRKLFRS